MAITRAREQKVRIANIMRANGASHQEIAEAFGVSRSTVRSWFYDPDRVKQNERRKRYAPICSCGCGQKVRDGARGYKTKTKMRLECYKRIRHEEARENVIQAFRRYWNETGEIPDAKMCLGGPSKPPYLPWTSDVQRLFGSWNNAIRAAGFNPRPPGYKKRDRVCPPPFPENQAA